MKYVFSTIGLAALASFITSCGGSGGAPANSGSTLLITRGPRLNKAVYLVDSSTGEALQQLTDGTLSDEAPRWSPDGAQIAFLRHIKGPHPVNPTIERQSQVLYLMNADGSNQQNLTPLVFDDYVTPGQPAWLNNDTLAFQHGWIIGAGLVTFSINSRERKTLTTPDSANLYTDERPSVSSSGTKLAFVRSRLGGDVSFFELYVANTDGSGARSVVDELSPDAPAWSPDGKRMAFVRLRGGRNQEIYVANADGSNLKRLTDNPAADFSPVWSPDGKKIVFASDRDGNDELYQIDADGSNLVRITNNDVSDIPYGWR